TRSPVAGGPCRAWVRRGGTTPQPRSPTVRCWSPAACTTAPGRPRAPSGNDPATGTWRPTGSMAVVRGQPTAVGLGNGSVLVAGGTPGGCCSGITSAELYDPATGSWRTTGGLATGRRLHSATMLADGRVLLAGGYSCCDSPEYAKRSAELY